MKIFQTPTNELKNYVIYYASKYLLFFLKCCHTSCFSSRFMTLKNGFPMFESFCCFKMCNNLHKYLFLPKFDSIYTNVT